MLRVNEQTGFLMTHRLTQSLSPTANYSQSSSLHLNGCHAEGLQRSRQVWVHHAYRSALHQRARLFR